MSTCLGKRCSLGLPCKFFVNVYQCVGASFPFGFEDVLWGLIVLVPDYCLSFYFSLRFCLYMFIIALSYAIYTEDKRK